MITGSSVLVPALGFPREIVFARGQLVVSRRLRRICLCIGLALAQGEVEQAPSFLPGEFGDERSVPTFVPTFCATA